MTTIPSELPPGWYTPEWSNSMRADWWRKHVGVNTLSTDGVWVAQSNYTWGERVGYYGKWICNVCEPPRNSDRMKDYAKRVKGKHAYEIFKHLNSPKHQWNVTLRELANENPSTT